VRLNYPLTTRTDKLKNTETLSLKGIDKRFHQTGIHACNKISLTADTGEVLAIVGENAAGKSTLMNILCGTVPADEGTLSLWGNPVKTGSPKASSKGGIGMIHQHPEFSNPLSVTENIILGYEPKKFGIFTDYTKAEKKIRYIQEKYNLPLPLKDTAYGLNSSQAQRMELIHLLYNEKTILIFDEPTASLTDHKIDELLQTILLLKNEGKTILFISHKLHEVFRIADKIAVLRKGKLTLLDEKENLTPEQVAREMIGRTEEINYPVRLKTESTPGKPLIYSTKNLSYKKTESENLKNINLEIRTGEIVGIAGIRENGLELLEDIISGMKHCDSGELLLHGKNVTEDTPADLRSKGISYVPADRLKRGVSTDSTIAENLILLNYKRMHKLGILAPASINKWAEKVQHTYNIDGKPHQQIKYLSGGNIQKVILSRELHENPELIIICEPSWGLDFRSRNRLHEQLHRTVDEGTSILLISSDIDEILALSDKIVVLYDGRIVTNSKKTVMNRRIVGEYMLGIRSDYEKN
jgi:simple sugar transport system ATP-binding protein